MRKWKALNCFIENGIRGFIENERSLTVLILEKRSIVLFEVIAVLNNMLEIVILIDVCSPHRRVTETLIVPKPVLSVMFGTQLRFGTFFP